MKMYKLNQNIRYRKTRPWMDDEYMVVDGMKVVYTPNLKLVYMPGQRWESVERLRAQGRIVAMPKLLRANNYTSVSEPRPANIGAA